MLAGVVGVSVALAERAVDSVAGYAKDVAGGAVIGGFGACWRSVAVVAGCLAGGWVWLKSGGCIEKAARESAGGRSSAPAMTPMALDDPKFQKIDSVVCRFFDDEICVVAGRKNILLQIYEIDPLPSLQSHLQGFIGGKIVESTVIGSRVQRCFVLQTQKPSHVPASEVFFRRV